MPQRRKGERVLGPYRDGEGYRVIRIDAEGKRISETFKARKAALTWIEAYLGEANEGETLIVREGLRTYEADLVSRGNKADSIRAAMHRARAFFPGEDEWVRDFDRSKCDAAYELVRARVKKSGEAVSDEWARSVLYQAKDVFTFWARKGWIKENPATPIEPRGRRRKGKPQLHLDEARKWRDAAFDVASRDPAGVAALCLLYLGTRASEVVERRVRDIDDDARLFWIPDSKTEAGRRVVEVPEDLRPFLRQLTKGRAGEEYVWPGEVKGHRGRWWLWDRVRRICRTAGVPIVGAHSMRGLHATLALRAGATGHAVAAALGHETESMTLAHYAKPGSAEAGRQRRLLGVLDGGKKRP